MGAALGREKRNAVLFQQHYRSDNFLLLFGFAEMKTSKLSTDWDFYFNIYNFYFLPNILTIKISSFFASNNLNHQLKVDMKNLQMVDSVL